MKNFKKLIKEAHLGNPLNENKYLSNKDSYIKITEPSFRKDKNNPNFLYGRINYDTGPGVGIALGKETMAGQIRRLSSMEAMRRMKSIAVQLEDAFDLEDIEVTDLENGVVELFAVSDDFIDMDPRSELSTAMLEENQKYDDEDIVIYDGEEHIIMRKDGNMVYIRPLEDSAILGKRDEIKVPARALAYKSDLDKMYDEYKPKDEVNEEDRATRVDKMLSGEYEDEDYKDSKRYADVRADLEGEINEVDEKWDKIARDEYGKPWMELSIAQKQEMLSYANRETEKQFQTDYEKRRKGDLDDEYDGMTDYQRGRMDEDMGEWPKELSSRYSDEYRFELEKVTPTYQDKPGRAKYRVIDIESGELKGTPVFGTPESLMAFADDLIKPQGGTQSSHFGTNENINDPALVRARAAKMAVEKEKAKQSSLDKRYGSSFMDKLDAELDLKAELEDLNHEREMIMIDMEEEAEPEGGPIADRYGERLNQIDMRIADIQEELDDLRMYESVNKNINENTLGDLVKKYGKDLINFVIGIDELTPEEIKDTEYLDDRIQIHLEEPEIRQKYLPEGTCGYGEDGVIGDKPAGPDLNENEIPLWLTDNREFEKAVIVSTSYNDFEKRAYGILGPKYFKLLLSQSPGVLKDYYDSIRVTRPNLEEDDELNVNVDNANDNYAKAIDAESRSGAYESLQESLRKKLKERLK